MKSEYDVLLKKKNKALKVFSSALSQLEGVAGSIKNLREANQVAMQDARLEIEDKEDFIQTKANANSMLQTDLEKTEETMSKIAGILQ